MQILLNSSLDAIKIRDMAHLLWYLTMAPMTTGDDIGNAPGIRRDRLDFSHHEDGVKIASNVYRKLSDLVMYFNANSAFKVRQADKSVVLELHEDFVEIVYMINKSEGKSEDTVECAVAFRKDENDKIPGRCKLYPKNGTSKENFISCIRNDLRPSGLKDIKKPRDNGPFSADNWNSFLASGHDVTVNSDKSDGKVKDSRRLGTDIIRK